MKRAKNDPLTIVALLTLMTLLGVGIVGVTGLPPNWHVLRDRYREGEGKAQLSESAQDAIEFLTDDSMSVAELPEDLKLNPDDFEVWSLNPPDNPFGHTGPRAPFVYNLPQQFSMDGPVVEVLTPYVPGSARYINAPWSKYKLGADARVSFEGFTEGFQLMDPSEQKDLPEVELLEEKDWPEVEMDWGEPESAGE